MRTPGFGKAAQQRGIGRLEKKDLGRQHFAQLAQQRRKLVQSLPLANINHQGGSLDLRRLADQVRKCRQQIQRQIVYGIEAEIFKGLESRGLAGAGEAGDDDQLAWQAVVRRVRAVVLRIPSRTRARGGCAFARHGHMLKHFLRCEVCDCNTFREVIRENRTPDTFKRSAGASFPQGARIVTNVS